MAAKTRGTGWLAGALIGALLALLAPLMGVLFSLFGINRAFSTSGSPAVPPDEKARVLAEGISESMNMSALGLIVSFGGVIMLVVSLIGYFRVRRAATQPNPVD